MEHDFGVVRPGQRCTHTFAFVNPSKTPLRSARINRSCTCTVAEITPPVIEPGAEASIHVVYEAPAVAATDSKTMGVQFKDDPSLRVMLRVEATIRPALYLPEREVAFAEMPRDARRSRAVRVQNFGDEPWSSISVNGCPNWLTWRAERVESEPSANADAKKRPLEEWSVVFTSDESRLTGDEAEATLVVEGKTPDPTSAEAMSQAEFTVRASVERKLQAFPSRLHVRSAAGEAVRKNLILKLGPNFRDARADDFQVTHDLGKYVTLGEIAGSGPVRRVTLSFQHRPGNPSGSISIRLKPAGSAEPVAQTVIPIVFSE